MDAAKAGVDPQTSKSWAAVVARVAEQHQTEQTGTDLSQFQPALTKSQKKKAKKEAARLAKLNANPAVLPQPKAEPVTKADKQLSKRDVASTGAEGAKFLVKDDELASKRKEARDARLEAAETKLIEEQQDAKKKENEAIQTMFTNIWTAVEKSAAGWTYGNNVINLFSDQKFITQFKEACRNQPNLVAEQIGALKEKVEGSKRPDYAQGAITNGLWYALFNKPENCTIEKLTEYYDTFTGVAELKKLFISYISKELFVHCPKIKADFLNLTKSELKPEKALENSHAIKDDSRFKLLHALWKADHAFCVESLKDPNLQLAWVKALTSDVERVSGFITRNGDLLRGKTPLVALFASYFSNQGNIGLGKILLPFLYAINYSQLEAPMRQGLKNALEGASASQLQQVKRFVDEKETDAVWKELFGSGGSFVTTALSIENLSGKKMEQIKGNLVDMVTMAIPLTSNEIALLEAEKVQA